MNTMRPYVPPFSTTMKVLLGLNLGVWVFGQLFLERFLNVPLVKYFALFPGKVFFDGSLWQLVTYMFMHSLSPTHIVFNLLMLWMLGSELELRWGRRYFLGYYLGSGVGAAVLYCICVGLYALYSGEHQGLVIPVIGASGAIFGLLLAYGVLFGERVIHFMMLFPMKAKYFVMILGGIEVVSLLTTGVAGGEVANLAHLGGLVAGYLILKGTQLWRRRSFTGSGPQKARKLRLVVNNDREDKKDGPKYWN